MSRYADLARRYWQENRPRELAGMQDPELFFRTLSSRMEAEVAELADAMVRSGTTTTEYVEAVGAHNVAWKMAEERVLSTHLTGTEPIDPMKWIRTERVEPLTLATVLDPVMSEQMGMDSFDPTVSEDLEVANRHVAQAARDLQNQWWDQVLRDLDLDGGPSPQEQAEFVVAAWAEADFRPSPAPSWARTVIQAEPLTHYVAREREFLTLREYPIPNWMAYL